MSVGARAWLAILAAVVLLPAVVRPAIATEIFYIVPEKCTECVGHFDQEQCAAVCPVDCCVPDPNHVETEDVLYARAKAIHPEKEFAELGASTSHFRKG